MTIETFMLYQTLAQSGVPSPTEPAAPDQETKVNDAPNVWYVKEVVNPEWDETLDDPTISSDDTGKRYFMYVISGGPVLGNYSNTRGVTMAYIPEGDHLLGWWYNGQLFGIPIAVNDAQSV